ncbi:YndJ family transporter, partial [Cellulosimicrobium cellulans]|uniref:YndJ family transporter n=1 Tax=Cellulosimicrobium cellulans TaxID=1710 RepID=UPI001495D1B4
MSAAGQAVVAALLVLGMVVVLPLGLRLLGRDVVPAPQSPLWPLAGCAGAVSLLVPRGPLAVALAGCFAAATAVLLAAGVRLLARAA